MVRRGAAAALLLCLASGSAAAQQQGIAERPRYYVPSSNDYGGVGLLQMRTARFHEDATLDVGAAFVDPYRRYYITFQAVPWLEATFRYTDVRNRLFSNVPEFSGDQSYKDRGADLKLRLIEESEYIPQIAVGLQDGLGTGLFSSEYIVASKRYYDLDFTFGVAWGQLGAGGTIKNPLIQISESFRDRETTGAVGGEANLGTLFSGETIGFFGGVEWYTPVNGLVLKLEYDGNDYQSEPLDNRLQQDLPVNIGLVYRPLDFFELAAGLERGNTAMFRASLRANVRKSGVPKFDPPPPEVKQRPRPDPAAPVDPEAVPSDGVPEPGAPEPATAAVAALPVLPVRQDPAAAPVRPEESAADEVALLFDGLEASGFEIESVELLQAEARIHLSRGLDVDRGSAIQEAAEIVAAAMPGRVDQVTLIQADAPGAPPRQVTLRRADIERAAIADYLYDGLEALGLEVLDLRWTDREAELRVRDARPDAGWDETAVADLLLRALPVAWQQATIVHTDAEGSERRVRIARDDAKRGAEVARLFDDLEADGFEVESIDVGDRQAVVRLRGRRSDDDQDFKRAARLVADAAPTPLDEVVVVGMRAGMEATRVSLRRRPKPAGEAAGMAAGGAVQPVGASEFVAELTPEERRGISLQAIRALEKESFTVDAFRVTRDRATAYLTPRRYRQLARNIGRAARVIASNVPDSVEQIEVVTLSAGLEISRVTIMRRDLEDAVLGLGSPEEIAANADTGPPLSGLPPFGTVPDDAVSNPSRYPSFSWSLNPALREQIGGADGFFLYQLYAKLNMNAELYRGLSVSASLGRDIVNTFDELKQTSDSVLPHVRSDIAQYLRDSREGFVARLQADYLFHIAPDWYGRVSAGLFEEMFGGVGGEILYRPYGSRLAVSVDLNRVRQRTTEVLFDFRDYEVTTGHANIYYKFPWLNLLGEIHAGQFLAGDRGAQFALSRGFESGVRIGAWATFTNVSPEEFGEGAFDKGFFISVPFDVFLPRSSPRSGTFAFRPLSRDGGQILAIGKRLYGVVEGGNVDGLASSWSRFLD